MPRNCVWCGADVATCACVVPVKNPHAVALGSIKSPKKAATSAANGRRSAEEGKKGGRPRTVTKICTHCQKAISKDRNPYATCMNTAACNRRAGSERDIVQSPPVGPREA